MLVQKINLKKGFLIFFSAAGDFLTYSYLHFRNNLQGSCNASISGMSIVYYDRKSAYQAHNGTYLTKLGYFTVTLELPPRKANYATPSSATRGAERVTFGTYNYFNTKHSNTSIYR